MVKKKSFTIDDLAIMVKNGFDQSSEDLGVFRDEINKRFDRIENIMLAGHE